VISINPYEILMQIVNFSILLWLLSRFLIKPLQKYLNERSSEIKSNIDNAKESKEKADALLAEQKELLKTARVEAKEIREKTEDASKKEQEEMLERTKEESARLIAQAKKEIELDIAKAKKDLLSEAGDLVVELSQKVLSKKLDDSDKQELVESNIRKLQGA